MFPEIKKILYATDLGDHMRPVFRFALSLAEKYQAKISMVHVTEPLSPQVQWAMEVYMPEADLLQAERENLQTLKDRMRTKLIEACQEELGKSLEETDLISDVHAITGRPADALVKIAEEWDIDIIVVGSHTDSSFGANLLGSTASKVTQLSRRPVLVIPVYEE